MIPALDRGLKLVELVLLTGEPVRFSGFRQSLPGISDASLTRLLDSLREGEYLEKVSGGGYIAGERLEQWRQIIQLHADKHQIIRKHVQAAARESGESAAFGTLYLQPAPQILIDFSVSMPDSIMIIQEKGVLHFEHDHAGALAVLDSLDSDSQQLCINSQASRISNPAQLQTGLNQFKKSGFYLDESESRPGVSRIAVPLTAASKASALFLCMPTARAKSKETRYVQILLNQLSLLSDYL